MAILPRLTVWAALSTAMASATNTEPWAAYPISVTTAYPTCPPPVTVNNTQYYTKTVFETIVYTKVLTTTQPITETTATTETEIQLLTETLTTPTTEVQLVTETDTTVTTATETETTPTTELVTLTATEKQELYTSTTRLTSLIICPSRTVNPTFTVDVPMPSQWTWGCPPGWVCKPLQENCNFEAGLPDRNFYCAPNECVPAQVLPEPLPNWNSDPTGNGSFLTDPSLGVVALPDIFNMNPTDFGLSYSIFIVDEAITLTSTYLLPPAATGEAIAAPQNNVTRFRGRQAQTTIPEPCYSWCNNALLEAQSSGKSPKICQPESAYLITLESCQACVDTHRSDVPPPDRFVRIAPQFQQFMDYCAGFLTTTVSGTMVSTETSGTDVFTTTVPTSTVTAIPTSDVTETVVPTVVTTGFTSTTISGIAPEPPSTITGSEITGLTVLLPTDGTTLTLSGSDLEGATLVLPAVGASQSEVVTSGESVYTTDVTSTIAASGSDASSDAASSEGETSADAASATTTGSPVETGDSLAGALEAPKAFVIGAAVIAGFAL